MPDLPSNILELSAVNEANFESQALTVFHYQAENCLVYKEYLSLMGTDKDGIQSVKEIPFLPIEFFKSRDVIAQGHDPNITFTSSGTTGKTTSKHLVVDNQRYINSFRNTFSMFYGNISDYCILGLLPSYLEQGSSSLVYMVNDLIEQSGHPLSGFYLNNYAELDDKLKQLNDHGDKIILFGVSYALLDMAADYPQSNKDLIVIETGGMKGRRKEIIREELHRMLISGFGTSIHSEYGMTELLSQAYAQENGIFHCPPWMKVFIADLHDPKSEVSNGKTGRINVIDLANVYSCSFIATSDLGQGSEDGGFRVLGRMDNSDIRGCNLLV